MKNKPLIAILILFVIVLGVWATLAFKNTKNDTAPIVKACTEEAKICPDGSAVGRTGPNCEFAQCPMPQFSWNFSDAEEDKASGVPHTRVTLKAGTKSYDVGTYDGSCTISTATSSWPLLSGELTGTICYFAGGGTELGVFEENSNYVIKKGDIDEGSAEAPGVRGNFKAFMTL